MGTLELGLLKKVLRERYEGMFQDPKLRGISKENQEVMIQVTIDDYINNNILKLQPNDIEDNLNIPAFLRKRNRKQRERSRG